MIKQAKAAQDDWLDGLEGEPTQSQAGQRAALQQNDVSSGPADQSDVLGGEEKA